MFNAILDAGITQTGSTEAAKINWLFTELWRFAFVGTEHSQREKHINNGNVLPCCFDYRPSEDSVSLHNVLSTHETKQQKAEVINELILTIFKSKRWGKVCIEKERMQNSLTDPMTKRILKRIKLDHNNGKITELSTGKSQHWDLRYLSEDGNEITASEDDQLSAFDIKNYFVEISYFFVDSK
ncbi:hypothetical protein GBN32_10340 [Plesiomonas shigelloides]|uniref:hypothetical protein n=1 Tax=Plesiomonas shigelloides TaxID=703 RepID=UPI001262030F|nr:hypothetical protein [Plesiomonas shigelloides]KAB7710699.1 hypothetical protein GBN32_10340 [Plesiomonas shigelloides]